MDIQFPPVLISYQGLDADNSLIDLGQLGQSIQGASKLLGIAAHIVTTGQYAKKTPALAVKVMARPPVAGSFDIAAILMTAIPALAPMLPVIADRTQELAGRAVEGIVNYTISKFAGRESDAGTAKQIAETALIEMGHTSRTAIAAMERVVLSEKPAARMFVSPVGQTCETAQVGSAANGALAINRAMRDVIDESGFVEIGPETTFEILLSELDLKNRSCKFQIHGVEEEDQRLSGEITDPVLLLPHNPYSAAIDNQRWLAVKGKAQFREGEMERLYISNALTA